MIEPLVSIITPTFNRVSTGELDRAIKSVDEQLDNRWKHYIIGDGCKELERYKKKLDKSKAVVEGRRVIVNLEKRSNDLGATPHNYGLVISNEPYFCVLADDNVWLPHHLAALLEFMVRNEGLYGIVWGNQIIRHKRIPEFYKIRSIEEPTWNYIDIGDPIYRRELWNKFGPFKYKDRPDIGDIAGAGGKYSYDWHFIYDCIAGGTKWVHMNFDPSSIYYMDDRGPIKSTNWGHTVLRIGALPQGDQGVAWYRIKYPLNEMMERGKALVSFSGASLTKYKLETWLQNQEVMLFQCVATRETANLITRLKHNNKVCVIDVDDYIHEIDYDNTNYKNLGKYNVSFKFTDKQKCLNHLNLWLAKAINLGMDQGTIQRQIERVKETDDKDFELQIYIHGKEGFDVERNLRALAAAEECYRAADGIQTTTEYFAEKLRKYNDNVFVYPNCLDFNIWDASYKFVRNDDKIRIVWSGGDSHLEDLMLCRDALSDVLGRHSECIFVCAGFTPEGFARAFDRAGIEVHPWWDFKIHPFMLNRLKPDIGIIPLRSTEFARCKSPIKWVELSALGIPCVASNEVVYNRDIKDGESGFLFDTPAQFAEKLEILIRDKKKRMEMGEAALRYVRKNYDIKIWAPRLLRWYEKMWLKKHINNLDLNTLAPVMKARWEKEAGHKIDSVKALDRVG